MPSLNVHKNIYNIAQTHNFLNYPNLFTYKSIMNFAKRLIKSSLLVGFGSASAFVYIQKKEIKQSYSHPKSEYFQQNCIHQRLFVIDIH